jgi:RimJ/RimL family protein N-acetyltransferase
MLEKMYSTESLKEQMQIKQHHFFLLYLAEEAIGFISMHEENTGAWFLNKFYINQQKASKGLGSAALQMIIAQLKVQKMTLTVNRQNYKSINFYFKNGFVIERVADFDIGNGYVMNDFVMVWEQLNH